MRTKRYLYLGISLFAAALLLASCASMGKAGKEEMHPEGTVTVSLERGKREVSGSLPLTLDEVELGTAVITVELTGYMTERIPVGEPIAEWYLNNPLYNGINGFAVIDLHGEKRAVSEGQLDIGSATAYGKEGAEKTLLVVRYGETDTELRTTLIELTPDE